MSEDKAKYGYAEGIDRTEASLNIIHTILDVINTEIADLERRVQHIEEAGCYDWRESSVKRYPNG